MSFDHRASPIAEPGPPIVGALRGLFRRGTRRRPSSPTAIGHARIEARDGEAEICDRNLREIKAGQLAETLDHLTILAATHSAIVVAVLVFFWDTAPLAYLIGLCVAVAGPISALALMARANRRAPCPDPSLAVSERAVMAVMLTLGLAWGTMPIMLFTASDADHRLFVVAIMAGLIASTYTLRGIASLLFLFAIPVVLGSFLALGRDPAPATVSLAVLLVVYALFVLASAHRMMLQSRQHMLDRIRVTEQKETIALLLNEFEANTSDWLWETDRNGRLQHVSDRIAEVSGRSAEALQGAPFETLLPGSDGDAAGGRNPSDSGVSELLALIRGGTAFRDHVVELPGPEAPRWWRLSGKPTFDRAGALVGFRGVGSDITASRRSEARIAYLASYDPLTCLANRTLFRLQAGAECERAVRENVPCALIYLDLDGFKIVNDTFGHGFGDRLLQQVGLRLRTQMENGELVARLGGDEFAVLLRGIGDEEAVDAAERLIAALSAPYALDGIQVGIGASAGIAMTPRDAADPESLLGRADLALYRSKGTGKGRVSVFEPILEGALCQRRQLEADLKVAIAEDEFELHYQPLVSLDDGRVRAFEALLRWTTAARGSISPADFVPVAEASGLIPVIGRWVLREACREAAGWPDEVRVAVNISPLQFRTSDLVKDVTEALRASGLRPDRLELEITESVFFEMNPATTANLRDLRALGIRIALDDFGTGYSSLSYLIRFPVDKIKIDRSFIRDMSTRHECLAIIEAILTLARELSITVTAEGVETEEQARMLKARHCDDIQGFLFSQARPAGMIPELVESLPRRFCALVLCDLGEAPLPAPVAA